MRIKQVRIKIFRSFADETIVFGGYTSLVGPNGAGKSTVLSALNVFFKEQTNATSVEALSEEDFHQKNTGERVEISVTFYQLSPRALDDLREYVRGNELIVSAIAIWDEGKKVAAVQQFGSRLGIAALAPFFHAYEKGSAQDATNAFEALKQQFPNIGAPAGRSKDAKLEAIREFEREPANAHLLAPIESQDQFYGIAGNAKLRPYIQWVYVPAVKDAVDEQSESRDSALGRLLARTVRGQVNFKEELLVIEQRAQQDYLALLQANKEGLDRVAQSLTIRMSQWSHPDVALMLNWNGGNVTIREPTAKVSAGENGFEGDLARFGHGFQRSYLLSLLQELATLDLQDAPTLVLGIEEPELYQHPPQARYLAQVLQDLSGQNTQVMFTTHSPYFVVGSNFEGIRMVRKDRQTGSSSVRATTHEAFAERYAEVREQQVQRDVAIEVQLNEVLRAQLNEMFFASKVILVEGTEDLAYIMTWMTLSGRLPQFRVQVAHIIPVDGKGNISRPFIVAQALGISTYVVFDGDRRHRERGEQQADNRRLLRLLGRPDADQFPDAVVWEREFTQWPDDLSSCVNGEFEALLGNEGYQAIVERARVDCGLAPQLEKNTMFIQRLLMELYARGLRSDALDRLCDSILAL